MSNILLEKEFPFLFAILIAIFSWVTAHIVDRIDGKPTIEVKTSKSKSIPKDIIFCSGIDLNSNKWKLVHSFNLTNVSKNILFSKLSFLVTTNTGEIYGVRLRAFQPAVAGDIKESCSEGYGLFPDITLHPGWQFKLIVLANVEAKPSLRFTTKNQPVNLVESNFETWLTKNESAVLGVALLVLFLLILSYVIYISRRNSN